MKMYFMSTGSAYYHAITVQTDYNFLFLFLNATLLALKDTGQLNEIQHRQAEAELLKQYREIIRAHTASLGDD